jgi:flagellar biosynthesis/type III secretory pathway M-ring protein FliF/YscJ
MNQLFVILVLANFLRTIGIIVLIYFVLKFVGRLLFPIVVKKAVNNMQARQTQYQRDQKREGEVTIEKDRQRQSSSRKTEGEYVDFEEVD